MRMTLEHKPAYVVMTIAIVAFIVGSILYTHPLKWSMDTYLFSHDLPIFVISLTAVLLSFCIFKHKFDSRGAWKFFLLGFALWATAEFVWFLYEGVLGIIDPWPSLADVFWVAGYLPLAIGLFMYAKDAKAKNLFKNFLASVTGVAGSSLALIFIFGVNVFPSDVSFFEGILLLAYPIGDIFLLLLSLFLLETVFKHKQGPEFVSWLCLSGGFLLFAIYDIMFSYLITDEQMSHMLFNIIYLGAYLLIATAAFLQIVSKSKKVIYPYLLAKPIHLLFPQHLKQQQ